MGHVQRAPRGVVEAGRGRRAGVADGHGHVVDPSGEGVLREEQVLAYQFKGKRYDCGSKLGYLKASIDFALKHEELAEDFVSYLRKRFGEDGGKIEKLPKRA